MQLGCREGCGVHVHHVLILPLLLDTGKPVMLTHENKEAQTAEEA